MVFYFICVPKLSKKPFYVTFATNSCKMKFVYLFINFPFIWKCKIGISKDVRSRRKNISKTTPGVVLPIWMVYIPNADGLEKTMHGFFKAFRSPFRKGSGKSEWFMTFPVLPLAWLIMNFMFVVYWGPIIYGIWWLVQQAG